MEEFKIPGESSTARAINRTIDEAVRNGTMKHDEVWNGHFTFYTLYERIARLEATLELCRNPKTTDY